MSILKHYRLLRLSLVLLAIVAQCVALLNLWLLLVAVTLVVLSWYVTEGPRSHALPKWAARLAVVVAVAVTLVNSQISIAALPQLLGQFFVWLTLIKLFGGRSAENDAQEMLLSIVLMTIGGLYATDLLFGILLVAWGGLAAWVFMLFQLYYGIETMRIERYAAVPASYGVPWTRPVTGRQARAAFRRSATVLLAVGLVLCAAFFFIMPRGFSDDKRHLGESDRGVSRLDLSRNQDIIARKEQVMVVQLVDAEGVVFQLPEPLRLRGTVLERYMGSGVWIVGERNTNRVVTRPNVHSSLSKTRVQQTPFTMRVDLQRQSKKVYSLYRPMSIQTNETASVLYDEAFHTMEFSTSNPLPMSYSVKVDLQRTIQSSGQEMLSGQYQNEKVAALASGILEENGIDLDSVDVGDEAIRIEVASLFVEYLTSNAFQYSTDRSLLDPEEYAFMKNSDDPTEAFLLTMQSGHCEYFAASMVAMCDTVGLSARIITGYLTDRWDATTNQYIVLDSDAHAWVEAEVAPGLWRVFDPTPPIGASPTAPQSLSWLDSMRFAWIRLDREWKLNVLSFDRDNQLHLTDTLFPLWRENASKAWDRATTVGAKVVNWFEIGAGGLLWIVLVAGSVAGAGTVVVVVVSRRRRVRQTLELHNRAPVSTVANVEFYAQVIRILASLGMQRPPWQPAKTWVGSMNLPDETANLLAVLTEQYYEIRFGGKQLNRTQRLSLSSRVSEFARTIRKETA